MKAATLNCFRHNDHNVISRTCNAKAKDEVSSVSLLPKFCTQDLVVVICNNKMKWFKHIERITSCIAEVCKLNVVAQKIPGRPNKILVID